LAPDIEERTNKLIKSLDLEWLSYGRLFFYRSINSKARAYARAWGLPRLWQRTLNVEPAYIVEVISEHFDKLKQNLANMMSAIKTGDWAGAWESFKIAANEAFLLTLDLLKSSLLISNIAYLFNSAAPGFIILELFFLHSP